VWVSEHTRGEESGHHEHHPFHDIQFVMSGNGRDADHGYRFVIAGGPTKDVTRLYRNGRVMAETREFGITMGGHCNAPRTFHITVRRQGSRLHLKVDDRPLLTFTDPKPLGPGRIGFGAEGCQADFKDFTAFVDKPWLSKGLPAAW